MDLAVDMEVVDMTKTRVMTRIAVLAPTIRVMGAAPPGALEDTARPKDLPHMEVSQSEILKIDPKKVDLYSAAMPSPLK